MEKLIKHFGSLDTQVNWQSAWELDILTSVWVLHTAMPFSFFCSKNKKQRKRRKRRKQRIIWQKTFFLLLPKHWRGFLFPNKTALQPVSRTCGTTPFGFQNSKKIPQQCLGASPENTFFVSFFPFFLPFYVLHVKNMKNPNWPWSGQHLSTGWNIQHLS